MLKAIANARVPGTVFMTTALQTLADDTARALEEVENPTLHAPA